MGIKILKQPATFNYSFKFLHLMMFCVYLAELGQLVVEKNSKMGKQSLR